MSIKSRVKDGRLFATLWGIDLLGVAFYCGQYDNLVNGYAHDVLLPAGGFFFAKSINVFNGNKYAIATYQFLGCSAFEVAQGLGLYHGTFDPKDFLAYAAGTGLALGIDALTSKKSQKNLEEKLV
jgi:hypothetical protein